MWGNEAQVNSSDGKGKLVPVSNKRSRCMNRFLGWIGECVQDEDGKVGKYLKEVVGG